MKKYIITLLIISCLISLTACNEKENINIINTNNITKETNEPIKETDSKIPEIKEKLENYSDRTEQIDEKIKENLAKKGKINITNKSKLQTNPQFNGLYEFVGHSYQGFMFEANLSSISNENKGEVELSQTILNDKILNYTDFVYLSLTFDNEKIIDWDVLDKNTKESILYFTEEELLNYYFPESNFEKIEAGPSPETINLSNYEIGKTYVFNVNNEGNFSFPNIINDTEYPILTVSINKNPIYNNFEREYITKHSVQNKNNTYQYLYKDASYSISILETNLNDVFISKKCLNLEGYNIEDKLNLDREELIVNNTDKIFVLYVLDWNENIKFTLLPGEILSCSWQDDIYVEDIK